jgi:hypothetical protein
VDEFAGSFANHAHVIAFAIELRDLGKEFGFCRWCAFPIHQVIENRALKNKRIRFHVITLWASKAGLYAQSTPHGLWAQIG